MISVSTTTFDLDGARVFNSHNTPVISSVNRRVSRTATLDCDVYIYDGGQTDADRDITISVDNPSEADVEFCQYIAKWYQEVVVSCSDGAFLAAPVSADVKNGKLKFTLYIKEKLNG